MQFTCPQCGRLLEAPEPTPTTAQCPFCLHVFSPQNPYVPPVPLMSQAWAAGMPMAAPAGGGQATVPASFLLATGVLWVAVSALILLSWLVQGMPVQPPPPNDDPGFRAGYQLGQWGAYIGLGPVALILGALMILGAVQMLRRRSRGLAVAGSIAAMIPCSPCCLFGLPIGIWCLVALNKPEVRSTFT